MIHVFSRMNELFCENGEGYVVLLSFAFSDISLPPTVGHPSKFPWCVEFRSIPAHPPAIEFSAYGAIIEDTPPIPAKGKPLKEVK